MRIRYHRQIGVPGSLAHAVKTRVKLRRSLGLGKVVAISLSFLAHVSPAVAVCRLSGLPTPGLALLRSIQTSLSLARLL